MKLIVGLGNPGVLYSGSRHNIGFQVVKHLAKAKKSVLKKEKGASALSAKARFGETDAVLALPLTFMNLSGEAVKLLLKKHKAGLGDLLVVCDDLDLEFGRLRLRAKGSSAGHRGIQSIIGHLGSNEFSRLRVGIGRPGNHIEAADYVLEHFNKKESGELAGIIKNAAECCESWVNEGLEKSMGVFNKRGNVQYPNPNDE